MNYQSVPAKIIIQGVTRQGMKFRPSDWAERLQDCLAVHGTQTQNSLNNCISTAGMQRTPSFSPYVYINFRDGIKSLVVDRKLWETKPRDYEFLVNFSQMNNLNVIEEWAEAEIRKVA